MASLCRSAVASTARSVFSRTKSVLPKPHSTIRGAPVVLRSTSAALETLESMMPLHSAIASARLKSFIAANSSCWSWLSQGFEKRI
ncbi:envelope glycoprotein isoform X1 [Wolffia australiana]